jgi:hypothetical protein
MKKLISIILALAMFFVLTSCGNGNSSQEHYKKIKFYKPSEEAYNASQYSDEGCDVLVPKNREEFMEYLNDHINTWYGCEECKIYIGFFSSSEIPANYMTDIPITSYMINKYYPDKSYNFMEYNKKRITRVSIKYGIEGDMEAFADCIERLAKDPDINDITFDHHTHP